jgi:hypothetical protein
MSTRKTRAPKAGVVRGSTIITQGELDSFKSNGGLPMEVSFRINQGTVQGISVATSLPEYSVEQFQSTLGARTYKTFQTVISKDDLQYLYKRCDIAANAVDVPANDIFSKWFKIQSSINTLPPELELLDQRLHTKDIFLEAYRYCRLYGLGIVVLGLADDQPLDKPVGNVTGIDYLRAYSSREIYRIEWDEDPQSATFGQIKDYVITLKKRITSEAKIIHASRIIHVMEKTIEKSPWGISVLEPGYDLFQILKNTDWSAGEAYFQQASPLFVLNWEVTPDKLAPTAEELSAMRSDLETLHVLKRFIKPSNYNLDVVPGSGRLPDPGMIWNPLVERIAGSVKVPKTILLGTSAGALASGETNLAQYYKDVASVQGNFVEPMLRGFYTKLQKWKALSEGDFKFSWNSLWELDESEKTKIMFTKAQTAVLLMPIVNDTDWIKRKILGMTEEEILADANFAPKPMPTNPRIGSTQQSTVAGKP